MCMDDPDGVIDVMTVDSAVDTMLDIGHTFDVIYTCIDSASDPNEATATRTVTCT